MKPRGKSGRGRNPEGSPDPTKTAATNEHRSERSEQSNTAPRARAAKVRCASVGGAQPTSAGTMSETRFSSREE